MENATGITIVMLFMIALTFLFLEVHTGIEKDKILDQKCQDLGYLEYAPNMGFQFCEDKIGNLHYVNYKCEYLIDFLALFPEDCTMNKITIGEVEVKQ